MLQLDSRGLYHSPLLSELGWLQHGFGTRLSTDWPELERLAIAKQVHSNLVIDAESPGVNGEADALITGEPGLMVGVKTADCVPILLVDRKNRAVAAVHAGWRGTSQTIVMLAVEKLKSRFGTEPVDVIAAIGPCIQRCCYEVGGEVLGKFADWLSQQNLFEKGRLDLIDINQRQLEATGVTPAHIDCGGPCTFCQPDEMHSFRRDGLRAGRMMSAIGVRPYS